LKTGASLLNEFDTHARVEIEDGADQKGNRGMRIQDEAKSGRLGHALPQKRLHFEPYVTLRVPVSAQIALPEMIGQHQRVLWHGSDNVNGRPEKGANRNRENPVGLGRFWSQQPFVATELEQDFAG
jgi:hypothetical protein